ncbi:MAG TPA: sterol desaturase family protein [Candidatus Acidoferrum sp.]|nr:sterol desaturase family protein [Candidatus Acidoferrum sp.]
MFDLIAHSWLTLKLWLAAHAVAPTLQALHLHDPSLQPDAIAGAGMFAILQIAIIACVFRPLETFAPAERWANRDMTKIDRLYTLIMLLGLFPLFSYLILQPFGRLFESSEQVTSGVHGLRAWVPWFDRHEYVLLAVYYVLYDLTYYAMHRLQHLIPWWWALHSMHHSQRQLNCWSNDRGSYLDGALQSFILAGVGVVMGIDIEDFALLTLISELVQNFSHTNTWLGFGPLSRLLVDPTFHRLHHMVADHEKPGFHNVNFGQVLSVWDVLFGTALYGEPIHPTGVADPTVDADNGRNLAVMQWYTLKRFWGSFKRRAGWKPGDVSFGEDYAPVHDK